MRDGARHGVFHAITTTWLAARLARVLRRSGLASFRLVDEEPDLAVPDECGLCLTYRVEIWMIRWAARLGEQLGLLSWLPPDHADHADLWRRILLADYVVSSRDEVALLVHAAHVHRADPPGTAICRIAPRAMAGHTVDCFTDDQGKDAPVLARRWFSLRGLAGLLWPLPHSPGFWLNLIWRGLTGGWTRPAHRLSEDGRSRGLIIEEAVHSSIAQYPESGHMYWIDGAGIPKERIAVYFGCSDTPASTEYRTAVEGLGLGWIDALVMVEHLDRPVRDSLAALGRFKAALPFSLNPLVWWRWSAVARAAVRIAACRAFFRTFNVKAFKNRQLFTQDNLAMILAGRLEGVMHFFNVWSVYQYPCADHNFADADLLLSWGPYNTGFYHAQNFAHRWIAEVGLVAGDGISEAEIQEAGVLRRGMSSAVSHVVAVFDTSYHWSIHSNQNQVADFYAAVAAVVARNSDWGMVIKSKGHIYDSLPTRSDLQPVIAALESEGRCIRLPSWYRVTTAASMADVVACSSINTTGFAAALLGKQALHLDVGGLSGHPLVRREGYGRLVFNSIASFQEGLERSRYDRSIGDHSAWCCLIDPWRGGRGRFRVGEILAAYLEARDGGAGKDAALDAAMAAYAARVGDAHVWRTGDGRLGEGDEMWADSLRHANPGWPMPDAW
jgi:hypothetical protein